MFDAELTNEQLLKKRDDRICEADWKDLIKYWRSPQFEVMRFRDYRRTITGKDSCVITGKDYWGDYIPCVMGVS
jgi:hypothetical protein